MANFPEEAIIHVTTHGDIKIPDSDIPVFTLPAGMTLLLLSAVSPGVCNLMTSDTSHIFTRTLQENRKSLIDLLNYASTMQPGANFEEPFLKSKNEIIELFRAHDKEAEFAQLFEDLSNADADQKEYVYSANKSYSLFLFKGGDLVPNKRFVRSGDEIVGEDPNITWDYKVNFVNIEGQPDLMTKIPSTRSQDIVVHKLNLEKLIERLHDNGVKKVFILDSSCYTLKDKKNKEMLPRDRRLFGRRIRKKFGTQYAPGKSSGLGKRLTLKKRSKLKRMTDESRKRRTSLFEKARMRLQSDAVVQSAAVAQSSAFRQGNKLSAVYEEEEEDGEELGGGKRRRKTAKKRGKKRSKTAKKKHKLCRA
jgi:hypothetical protein